MNTEEKLELLYSKKQAYNQRMEDRDKLLDSLIPQEIKDKQKEVIAEFEIANDAFLKSIADLEYEIKSDVLTEGKSVKSAHLHAVYTNGRVSWDAKGLDGYATAHPEIEKFKKVGDPSVSIREVKQS